MSSEMAGGRGNAVVVIAQGPRYLWSWRRSARRFGSGGRPASSETPSGPPRPAAAATTPSATGTMRCLATECKQGAKQGALLVGNGGASPRPSIGGFHIAEPRKRLSITVSAARNAAKRVSDGSASRSVFVKCLSEVGRYLRMSANAVGVSRTSLSCPYLPRSTANASRSPSHRP